MTFPVSRATRRTFYVEHFKEGYYVARVWEIGAVASGEEAVALMNRALNNAPLERIMGSQIHDEPPTHSRWITLVAEPDRTNTHGWRIVRRYEDGQEIANEDRDFEPRVLVEVDVIIPRPKPGQGVRMLTRNDELARTTRHAAEHILRGELPRDSGR